MHPKRQCDCPRSKSSGRSIWPVFAGIVIALIPKCPFCILAYSSAITLCSGAKIYQHSPQWTSYISIALAAITLILVLWNFKGLRTILAAGCVVAGSLFIVVSEIHTGSPPHYYAGATLLMFGVWMNANFMYFYRRYFRKAVDFCLRVASLRH
jgi:hypothetical protein